MRSNLQLRHGAAELKRLTFIDSLTGVNNRRSWCDKPDHEWRHAERYGHGPAFIMLDLDHFKAANDDFGHDAGDQLLRAVAEVLPTALRDTDALGRLGGDEFAVLLPDATAADAQVVAERMQELLKRDPGPPRRLPAAPRHSLRESPVASPRTLRTRTSY